MPSAPLLERLADLIVGFGANVQPGQIVALSADIGKEELVRAVAASAYRRGARFVDVAYFDPWVKRARIELADPDTLGFVPSWYGERVLALGEQRCARIGLSGPVAPGLLDDLDPQRAGRDQLPFVRESGYIVNARTTNWTIAPGPTAPWAAQVYPDLPPEAALERLWLQIAHICRLDEDDPIATWTRRMDALVAVADRLTERRLDALRFHGPGTDLRVGLLPSSRWLAARFDTVDGIEHRPNLPSEEVFTAPDPQRVDGHVRATKPLDLSGTIVRDLEVTFAGGRVTDIRAQTGADALRARTERDPGAARLGEVALVDREGRIGPLDTVFYDTLIDENAASHIALGNAYAFSVDDDADRARANVSEIHIDFMIGSNEVDVTGLSQDGLEIPVLRGGRWQI